MTTLRIFVYAQRVRIMVYSLLLLLTIGGVIGVAFANQSATAQAQEAQDAATQLAQQHTTLDEFAALKQSVISDAGQGITTTAITATYSKISAYIAAGNYAAANQVIREQARELASLVVARHTADAAAAAKKGSISGTVTDGKNQLTGAMVSLVSGGQTVSTVTTPDGGAYYFIVDAGTYSLTVTLANYTDMRVDTVSVTAQQNTAQDISLALIPSVTPTPTPTPTSTPNPVPKAPASAKPIIAPTASPPPSSGSRPYSTYDRTTVDGFSVTLMTFDLGSGHIKVMEDTADDTDCTDNCSVQSVLSFVQKNNGFAGINGSYFCPTAYPGCTGKTNSFNWKQYNSRLQKMINQDNGLGEQDPFLVFDSSGHATFFRQWSQYASSGVNLFAGISCTPLLVYGGQNVVDTSTLDSKQATTKSARAAIGLKGQTLYVINVASATIPDLGNVVTSLGLDSAMNIDGGGSVGMVYNNAYKLGPGRGVPNALIFAEQ